ncbi:MAG: phosphomethylpyrimidine synthase ThiC, partial [Bacteroidota bacterium]
MKENIITTTPFPASKKIFVKGKLHNINVAMREIEIGTNVAKVNGQLVESTEKKSLTVYDTSGPFTDPNTPINIHEGLPKLRKDWILQRGDVEELKDFSSAYAHERKNDATTLDIRFKNIPLPLKAKAGKNVSQLFYAKQGIVTAEMEYIAIRENQRIEEMKSQFEAHSKFHKGENYGAN